MALNNWMDDLDDNRTLNSIVMPASHDSGMATKETKTFKTSPTSKANACTQELNIGEQLAAGVRWIDVRLKDKSPDIDRCFHGGALGEKADQVAKAIIQFLNANRSEVVIVLLTKSGDATYDRFLGLLNRYHAYYSQGGDPAYGRIVHPGAIVRQIPALTLGQLRGRVVVAMDKPPKSQHKTENRRIVRAKLKKHDAKDALVRESDVERFSGTAGSGKYSYMLNSGGSYSNANSSKAVKSGQLSRNANLKPRVSDIMPVYYTTNTAPIGLRVTSIESADREMWKNSTLPKWARVAFGKDARAKLVYNAVMMDFASEGRCAFVRQMAENVGA